MKRLNKILIFLFLSVNVLAQKTIQIVTKTIEKSVSSKEIKRLSIVAEKASIEVNTWKKEEISYKIELKVEHFELTNAKSDLENVKLISEKIQDGFYLRSYIASKNNRPESDIRVKYTIYAPENLTVNIKNSFGNIEVGQLTKGLSIDADFCKTKINNIAGKQYYITRFGELNGSQLEGVISVNSDHTLVSLKNVSGSGNIKGVSGEIKLGFEPKIGVFNIETSKSTVDIIQNQWNQFNYQIKAEYTKCQTPQDFNWVAKEKYQNGFYKSNSAAKINLNMSFGSLKIR